jgi:hypothetical protein
MIKELDPVQLAVQCQQAHIEGMHLVHVGHESRREVRGVGGLQFRIPGKHESPAMLPGVRKRRSQGEFAHPGSGRSRRKHPNIRV